MAKTWCGEVGNCDICCKPITESFVDGKTRMGPWAKMCHRCVMTHGVGLGLGRGQRYTKNAKGVFEKVEG